MVSDVVSRGDAWTAGSSPQGSYRVAAFFRSLSQWSPAFHRYLVAAGACRQLFLGSGMAHMSCVYQVAEVYPEGPHLDILYDELLRRSWAQRAEHGDPSRNITVECQTVQQDTVALAQSRLAPTLTASGVWTAHGQRGGSAQGSASAVAADAALTQQAAAADALSRRAQHAWLSSGRPARRIGNEQGESSNRWAADALNSNGDHKGGGYEGATERQMKSASYKRVARKGGRGRGGKGG